MGQLSVGNVTFDHTKYIQDYLKQKSYDTSTTTANMSMGFHLSAIKSCSTENVYKSFVRTTTQH